MTEVVNTVQSEEAREALVQVVEYHRSMIKGFKKGRAGQVLNLFYKI